MQQPVVTTNSVVGRAFIYTVAPPETSRCTATTTTTTDGYRNPSLVGCFGRYLHVMPDTLCVGLFVFIRLCLAAMDGRRIPACSSARSLTCSPVLLVVLITCLPLVNNSMENQTNKDLPREKEKEKASHAVTYTRCQSRLTQSKRPDLKYINLIQQLE